MKSRITRMSPELYDFLKTRAKNFNTSMITEQKNMVKIMGEVERKLGIDMKQAVVTTGGIKFDKKVWVLK